MTEGKVPYLDRAAMNESAGIASLGASLLTAMFSFEASGVGKQELRKDVIFVLNEMVDGPALGFPGYVVERIIQFQVSEPWQYQVLQKWHCDVYVLCEIAPGPTALNQGLTTARMRADAELEASGDESPDVVAGERSGKMLYKGDSLKSNW